MHPGLCLESAGRGGGGGGILVLWTRPLPSPVLDVYWITNRGKLFSWTRPLSSVLDDSIDYTSSAGDGNGLVREGPLHIPLNDFTLNWRQNPGIIANNVRLQYPCNTVDSEVVFWGWNILFEERTISIMTNIIIYHISTFVCLCTGLGHCNSEWSPTVCVFWTPHSQRCCTPRLCTH